MTKSPWMNLLEPTIAKPLRDDGYFSGGTPPADASIAISLRRIADALERRNAISGPSIPGGWVKIFKRLDDGTVMWSEPQDPTTWTVVDTPD